MQGLFHSMCPLWSENSGLLLSSDSVSDVTKISAPSAALSSTVCGFLQGVSSVWQSFWSEPSSDTYQSLLASPGKKDGLIPFCFDFQNVFFFFLLRQNDMEEEHA